MFHETENRAISREFRMIETSIINDNEDDSPLNPNEDQNNSNGSSN